MIIKTLQPFSRKERGSMGMRNRMRTLVLLLMTTLMGALVMAQAPNNFGGTGGTPTGFQVDANFLSQQLGNPTTAPYNGQPIIAGRDWAGTNGVLLKNLSGVYIPGKNSVTNANWIKDEVWAGNRIDLSTFAGSNKNDDDISASSVKWGVGAGSGPQKNDITNVFVHTFIFNGNLWLFYGIETRATNGNSYLDLEYNQAGIALNSAGTKLTGFGTVGGRTIGDLLLVVDYEQGGNRPRVEVRTWTAAGLWSAPSTTAVDGVTTYITTNLSDVPHVAPGAGVTGGGDPSDISATLQFVEGAINLTALGVVQTSVCNIGSTLNVKTRSSSSFTSELKDYVLFSFGFQDPPSVSVNSPSICQGQSATITAGVTEGKAPYSYVWTVPAGVTNPGNVASFSATVAGTYSVVVTDDNGCTGEGSGTLTLKLPSSSTQSRTICSNELPYSWDGLTFTAAGTQTKTGLTNAAGCDSTASYTLVVNLTSSSSQSRTICSNELPYSWDGLTFTAAGTQTKTGLTNAAGCDSTATYTLIVNLTSSSTQSRTVCSNELPITWDGLTFTAAGTQTKTGLTNAAGCDSTASYTLVVNLTSSSSQSRTICSNELPYSWDGLNFTAAGTQTKTGLTNAAGCDSTATYTLIVNLTSSSSQSRTICSNELPYSWDGLTFTAAGTQTKTGLTNAAGCDSTASYTLVVNLTSSSSQSRTICSNELPYSWDGLTFTAAGTQTKTGLTNAAGCDSTATYTLIVNLTSSSSQSRTICSNELPYNWDGLTFTAAGTQTKTGLTNAAGCDSTATYILTANPNPECSIIGGPLQGAPICIGMGQPAPELVYSGPADMKSYAWSVEGDGVEIVGAANVRTVTVRITGPGSKTLKLVVTNNFDCSTQCSTVILPQANSECLLNGPEGKVCANSENEYKVGDGQTVEGFVYEWSIVGDAAFIGSTSGATVIVKAGAPGSYTVKVKVTSPGSCPSYCEATTEVELCGLPYCTYTQGYYGNMGGIACTPEGTRTTTQLITQSLANMPGGKLMLGAGDRTFTASTAAYIIGILPGGGTADRLPIGSPENSTTAGYLRRGKVNNTLLSQTIALALNTYMPGSNLGSFSLAAGGGMADKWLVTVDKQGGCDLSSVTPKACVFTPLYCTDGVTINGYTLTYNPYKSWRIPARVINALPGEKTVLDLLNLASAALGGTLPAGVSYSDIAGAAGAINEAFDECRIFVEFAQTGIVTGYCTPPAVQACPDAIVAGRQSFSQRAEVTQITVNAFPNPFRDQLNFRFVSPVSGRATLEVFNMHGQRLGVLFDGNISAGVANFVRYNSANVSGMLIYKLTVGDKVLTGKVQSVK